jgi:hypothetical protein
VTLGVNVDQESAISFELISNALELSGGTDVNMSHSCGQQ